MTSDPQDPDLLRLLGYLRESRGFDFSGYKRTTLLRRIGKRMAQAGIQDFAAYLDHLQVHPQEFPALFNTVLINVTRYFRDAAAWEYLRHEIIPRIVAGKERYEPIRVWSAGVASGEEAYSAAILLCEALGMSEYRDRVKIYATDVDEEALTQARQGRGQAKDLEEVPEELRDRYFEREGNHYTFRNELRRSVIFGRHDLVQDAPISRIDLLICRNTLMYFEAETQAKILVRLHYALNDQGFLFLGKAEMLLSRDDLFTPLDLKQRIFSKIPRVGLRDRLVVLAQASGLEPGDRAASAARLREIMSDALPVAYLVVDRDGVITVMNERTRTLFGLVPNDIGRPLQDLEISYQPTDLRSMIDQAVHERRPVEARDVVRHLSSGESQYFHVIVAPLLDRDGAQLGASISFSDVTSTNMLQRELERSRQELETASEELHSTNEELETTNEELQSTVEELETTNEELQSSNEELETMNEELESTNTELQAINTELQQRSIQLDQINAFMQQIMANFEMGVAVLDKELRVQFWNRKAEDLWGVRAGETVGHALVDLDIGLPVAELVEPIQKALNGPDGNVSLSLRATNRRGKRFICRVQCTAMASAEGAPSVIVMMEALAPTRGD